MSVLMLLEASEGPVLQEFPEDAPADEAYAGPVACPIPFVSLDEKIDKTEQMLSAFRQEVASMRNWYELAVAKRGRSTVSGLTRTNRRIPLGFYSGRQRSLSTVRRIPCVCNKDGSRGSKGRFT